MSLSTVILNFFKSQCDDFFSLNRWLCAVSVTSHSHIWPSRLRKDARTKLRPQLSQVRLETQSQSAVYCSIPSPKIYTRARDVHPLLIRLPPSAGSVMSSFFLIRKIKRRARTCIFCEHRALCQPHSKHKHWWCVGITQSQRREALPWKPHHHGSYSRNWSPFWI